MDPKKHVFISHSARDDAVARRIVAAFEAAGIKCWYSSRPSDLEPGVDWDVNIVSALDQSFAVVLIFSAAANMSPWVRRELGMSTRRGLPIYPIRIEDILPSGGIEPYLVSVQWVNAFSGKVDDNLAQLKGSLKKLISTDTQGPLKKETIRAALIRGFSASVTGIGTVLAFGFAGVAIWDAYLRYDLQLSSVNVSAPGGTSVLAVSALVYKRGGFPECIGELSTNTVRTRVIEDGEVSDASLKWDTRTLTFRFKLNPADYKTRKASFRTTCGKMKSHAIEIMFPLSFGTSFIPHFGVPRLLQFVDTTYRKRA